MSSEHIQVAVRLRPLNRSEQEAGERRIWTISRNIVMIRPESYHLLAAEKRITTTTHPSFQFDCCFSWEDDTQRLYDSLLKRMVLSTLSGYNATIFAYGQTGSGKTYTMLGRTEDDEIHRKICKNKRENSDASCENRRSNGKISTKKRILTPKNSDFVPSKRPIPLHTKGVMTLAFEDLFSTINSSPNTDYFLSCSYLEIYNEHIYDLLREDRDSKDALSVSETPDKEFYVKSLSSHPVKSLDDVLSKLEAGEHMRHYAETQLNHHSSRSHTIFRLCIKSLQVLTTDCEEQKSDVTENVTTESVLNFVDLAGSERINNAENSLNSSFVSKSEMDKTVSEGKHINTSLFYLCQVITKLAEIKLGMVKNESFVPFRNSILTKILRGSLGGNARTCVLCTATPALSQFEQTISTFRFGNSARSIMNTVQANVRHTSNAQLLLAYEQDVSDLRKELETTLTRSRHLSLESHATRLTLETRLKRLTQLMFDTDKQHSQIQYVGWIPRVGDVIPLNCQIKTCKKTLKCDENALFAEKRTTQITKKIANLKEIRENSEAQNRTLISAKNSLSTQLNSLQSQLLTHQNELNSLEKQSKTVSNRLISLRKRANLYVSHRGFGELCDEELSEFECELLLALDKLLDFKAQKRTQRLIKTLENRLKAHISGEEEMREMT